MCSDKVQTLTRADLARGPRLLSSSERRLDRSVADVEQERYRRIRDSDRFQALKRIFRTANFYKDLKDIARETKDEVDFSVDRMEASEAAFQAHRRDDVKEKLEFLLISERLYKRALDTLEKIGEQISTKDEMAHHISRSLDWVRSDIEEIEDSILKSAFDEAKIRVETAQLDLLSQNTQIALRKRIRDHKIEKTKYRILAAGCVIGGSVLIAATFAMPLIAPVADFAAGGAYLWAGRMYWKSKAEHVKMMTVKEASEDKVERQDPTSQDRPKQTVVQNYHVFIR
jgi:hypothetical protein